jgi:hypothetical protein
MSRYLAVGLGALVFGVLAAAGLEVMLSDARRGYAEWICADNTRIYRVKGGKLIAVHKFDTPVRAAFAADTPLALLCDHKGK